MVLTLPIEQRAPPTSGSFRRSASRKLGLRYDHPGKTDGGRLFFCRGVPRNPGVSNIPCTIPRHALTCKVESVCDD